jgi:hypothetical protein
MVTKTGAKQEAQGSPCRAARLLIAASLALAGCSLSAPEEGELFSPSKSGDAGRPDGSADAARDGSSDEMDASVSDAGDPVQDSAAAGPDAASTTFDPQAGLVVHYRFNETTGNTVNDFAGDNDAVISGTPSSFQQWIPEGHNGGALKLAGGAAPDGGTGHYVELPQALLLQHQEVSIALWLNRAGGPMWQRVFDLGNGQPTWIYFTAVGGTGLPVLAGRTPALIFVDFIPIPDALPVGQGQLRITQTIPVGTWTHVVITWSSTEIKAYLNGKLVGMTVPNGAVAPPDLGNTGQNYLGRSQFAPDPYFNGMLDEFRVYSRVLSASDVDQLFNLQ